LGSATTTQLRGCEGCETVTAVLFFYGLEAVGFGP